MTRMTQNSLERPLWRAATLRSTNVPMRRAPCRVSLSAQSGSVLERSVSFEASVKLVQPLILAQPFQRMGKE